MIITAFAPVRFFAQTPLFSLFPFFLPPTWLLTLTIGIWSLA